MNKTAAFLDFKFVGKDWKSSRVAISDLGAIREAIRYERRQCAMGTAPEALGVLMAQPVTDKEVWDYISAALGSALILFNCVSRANQEFTKPMAEAMVMENHEFVLRLFQESHLVNPTTPPTSSENSSGSA